MQAGVNIAVFGILCLCIIEQLNAKTMRGFYINKKREQIFDNPEDHLEKNGSWMWDFTEYGNCVRYDIQPFKLPRQLSMCFKINHDFTDLFNIMNFMSTRSGKSVVEVLKENP